MRLSDLKNGMVIEYRNGKRRLVLGEDLLNENLFKSSTLCEYNEDMTIKNCEYKRIDIVKVYSSYKVLQERIDSSKFVIWEREEVNWSEVKVDTPVLLRNETTDTWNRRYFAEYKDDKIYYWGIGQTSWSSRGGCKFFADKSKIKLAKEEDMK